MRNKTQVFTKSDIAALILKESGYKTGDRVVDPSCGDGSFIKEIAKVSETLDKVYGFDIDKTVLDHSLCPNIIHTNDSLLDKRITHGRFDIVVGNPPYLGYNECHKQSLPFFVEIKQKKQKLNNIFGINLHSTPFEPKKYSPKPNLFAFFIALGLKALKKGGTLAYLIPKTLFNSSDLDSIRYYLAKNTVIKKIILFDKPLFSEKTSSIVLILKKESPKKQTTVLFGDKMIKQSLLLKEHQNWNIFIKDTYDFIKQYRNNSFSLEKYHVHKDGQAKFYFDKGVMLGKEIKVPQGSQGLCVFDPKYRVFWRYMNPIDFIFEESNRILSHNYCLISSDDLDEILYLTALLKSSMSKKVLYALLKNDGEKDLLLGIKAIKKYIRIPKDISNKPKIITLMKESGFSNKIDRLVFEQYFLK